MCRANGPACLKTIASFAALSLSAFCAMMLAASAIAVNAPNDPHYAAIGSWGQEFADQWAVQQQSVYAAIAPEQGSQSIVVAVIDTGIDYSHEDLAAEKIWRNPQERKNGRDDDGNGFVDDLIGWNFVNHNNNPWDLSGHGTHIAGIIGACTNNGIGIAGINQQVQIMPLKVANFAGQAKSANVAAAIRYAVDHGARLINLSLGGELITELEIVAAQYAQERDVLIVVAAGNKGIAANQHGYADLPGVLVVGASDLAGQRAGFSNFGTDVALLAPGIDVLSLRAKDTDFIALSDPLDYPPESAVVGEHGRYYRASGTSFSTAVATGVASRVLSHRPRLTSATLREVLTQSAVDIAPPGVDQRSGYGQLNYISALTTKDDQFIHARLYKAELALESARLWIDLTGTAHAAQFAGARIELRAAPDSVPVSAPRSKKEQRRFEREARKAQKQRQRDGEPEPLSPYAWQVLSEIDMPHENAKLGRFSIDLLTELAGGSNSWQLRLVVNNKAGASREAHMSLGLPQPESASREAAENE